MATWATWVGTGASEPAVVATANSPPRGARLAAPRQPESERNNRHFAATSRLVGRYSGVPFLARFHQPRSHQRPSAVHRRICSANIFCSFIARTPDVVYSGTDGSTSGVAHQPAVRRRINSRSLKTRDLRRDAAVQVLRQPKSHLHHATLASHSSRCGQPAATHASRSWTRHNSERPTRTGAGIRPLDCHARHVRTDLPQICAARDAGTSRGASRIESATFMSIDRREGSDARLRKTPN